MNEIQNISLLLDFAYWLEKNGYLDTDWRAEPPYAIDEYLKEKRNERQKNKDSKG